MQGIVEIKQIELRLLSQALTVGLTNTEIGLRGNSLSNQQKTLRQDLPDMLREKETGLKMILQRNDDPPRTKQNPQLIPCRLRRRGNGRTETLRQLYHRQRKENQNRQVKTLRLNFLPEFLERKTPKKNLRSLHRKPILEANSCSSGT